MCNSLALQYFVFNNLFKITNVWSVSLYDWEKVRRSVLLEWKKKKNFNLFMIEKYFIMYNQWYSLLISIVKLYTKW